MKKFISGFIVGAMLFSVIGVFAVSYVANPVNFKVMVNGEEFVSDPPALVVEGRTYLPLRAIGDALGVPVNWNEERRQAEVGIISSAKDTEQPTTYKTYTESDDIIDFGDFCNVSPCKVPEIVNDSNGKYVTYTYDFAEVTNLGDNLILDYLELMQNNGYTLKEGENTLQRTVFYAMDYDNLDKDYFIFSLVSDITDLKNYIDITIIMG